MAYISSGTLRKLLSCGLLYLLTSLQILTFSQRKESAHLAEKKFYLGVNGHPLNTFGEYAEIPRDQQMDLIKKLNIKDYRFDITFNEKGEVKKKGKLDSLITIAGRSDINLLPVLSQAGLNIPFDTLAANNFGYKIGQQFSNTYGKYFRHIEIGNEMEIPVLKQRTLDGTDVSHYDMAKFKRVANFLKGLNQAIKESHNNVQTIINFGETHFGFIELLKAYQIDYDIIGHHWYYYKDFSVSGYITIINEISKIHDEKPIMITEFNYAEGSLKVSDEHQGKSTKSFIRNISSNPRIIAAYFYELLDESSLAVPQNKIYEKHLGIYKYTQKKIVPKKALSSKLNTKEN